MALPRMSLRAHFILKVKTMEDKCGCGCDEEKISVEQIAQSNHVLINSLLQLLLDKNVFSEHEFKDQINKLVMPTEKKKE